MLNRISIDEASKDFSKVLQIVDENGKVFIIGDDKQYIVQECNNNEEFVDSARFREISKKVLERNLEAYKELAK